jgi:hypothetical protein
MPSPSELRETSRLYSWVAQQESDLHLKRRLASHAFYLAQLAEKIEREAAARVDLAS